MTTSCPMVAFKDPSTKPARWWGTAPWLERFGRYARVLPIGATEPLAHRGINGAVTGRGADLTASAAYTKEFCDGMVLFRLKELGSPNKRTWDPDRDLALRTSQEQQWRA